MPGHEQLSVFACKRCGECCQGQGGIVLTPGDQTRLSACLEISLAAFLEGYTEKKQGKRVLGTKDSQACVFFQTGSGCLVHPQKPDLCRSWPFFRGNLLDELSWRMAQDSCPGINPEVEHREFVRQGLRYLQQQGLNHQPGPRTPQALVVDDLLPADAS